MNTRPGCGLATVALLAGLAWNGALAEPVELTIATTHTTNTPWVHVLETFFVPEFGRRLEAQTGANDYRFIEVYGGALSKWKISLETVESGLADIGWVGALWEPAKLPLQNRSEEHTSELQSRSDLVCRLLLETKKT